MEYNLLYNKYNDEGDKNILKQKWKLGRLSFCWNVSWKKSHVV